MRSKGVNNSPLPVSELKTGKISDFFKYFYFYYCFVLKISWETFPLCVVAGCQKPVKSFPNKQKISSNTRQIADKLKNNKTAIISIKIIEIKVQNFANV